MYYFALEVSSDQKRQQFAFPKPRSTPVPTIKTTTARELNSSDDHNKKEQIGLKYESEPDQGDFDDKCPLNNIVDEKCKGKSSKSGSEVQYSVIFM